MATQTAQIVFAMCGARKVRVIFTRAVAFEASLINFLGSRFLETEDLRRIPWIIHVIACRPVTCLTSLFRSTTRFVEGGLPMRTFLKVFMNVFVAVLARVWTDVSRPTLRWLGFFVLLAGSQPGKRDGEKQQESKSTERSNPGVLELQHPHPLHRM